MGALVIGACVLVLAAVYFALYAAADLTLRHTQQPAIGVQRQESPPTVGAVAGDSSASRSEDLDAERYSDSELRRKLAEKYCTRLEEEVLRRERERGNCESEAHRFARLCHEEAMARQHARRSIRVTAKISGPPILNKT